jgi:hypothetical protein
MNISREFVSPTDELGKFYKEYDGTACKAVIFSDTGRKAIILVCFKFE